MNNWKNDKRNLTKKTQAIVDGLGKSFFKEETIQWLGKRPPKERIDLIERIFEKGQEASKSEKYVLIAGLYEILTNHRILPIDPFKQEMVRIPFDVLLTQIEPVLEEKYAYFDELIKQTLTENPVGTGQGYTVKALAEKTEQTPVGNIIAKPVEAGQSNKAKRLRDIARNLSVWKESGPEGPENSKEARESAEEAMKLLRSNEDLLHYCKETYGFKYRQSESSLKPLYDILDYMRINDEAPEFITERTGYCDYQDFAQDHLINELNRWANEILQETEPQEKGGQSSGGNISGMRWQDAQKKAERIVNESESGFQGFMKLKKAVGCAKRTLTKAIKESPILTKAKSQYDAMSSTLKAVGVTPKVLATYKEKSEGPQLTNIEVEEILAEMMQQVEEDKPAMLEETKLNIKNMNPIQKHNLAKVYQEQYKSLKKHNRTHKDEKRTFFSEPKEPHQHKKV